MQVLIIRHGESEADILNVHEGRADFNLTERGHAQAVAMAEYVARTFKVSRIYASTLKRASQTAQHLSEATGIQITYEEDLMEFNNGWLAGLTHEEADEKYPEVPDLPIDQSVYGQESKVEFRNRADKVLAKILEESKEEQTIAIVSHGGMINQLYHSMLGLPIESKRFFGTADTGIHIWNVNGDSVFIIATNRTEHTNHIE